MKVNFTGLILDLDDKPIPVQTGRDEILEVLLLAGVPAQGASNLADGAMQFAKDKDAKRIDQTFAQFVPNMLAKFVNRQDGDADPDFEESDKRVELARRIRRADGAIEIDKDDRKRIEEAVQKSPGLVQRSAVRRLLKDADEAHEAAKKAEDAKKD